MYAERFYREWMERQGLRRSTVKIGESDLMILSDIEVRDRAFQALEAVRADIEGYGAAHADFLGSLSPIEIEADAPDVVRFMGESGAMWQVGPMAAVAGAVSESVARAALEVADTVIVENGGDIYAKASDPLKLALYAGEASPFAGRLAFEVPAAEGLAVCTSSGKVGPSLSFGNADAVVALHESGAMADAAATAIANRICGPADVAPVVAEERERGTLKGLIACAGDKLGLWGEFELIRR
jgi:ApbE superfamily uncharacterized protein (UPF0280 family)